jgi:hypothetical protein
MVNIPVGCPCVVFSRAAASGGDSFFGVHKDTLQGKDILGSLVVIYPTPHNGGELVLCHEGREWKSDAGVLTASQTSPSLAYVAFRSNVEHEVLKVKTGRRVTVTYNLYLFDSLKGPGIPPVTRNVQNVSNLQTTLRGLLEEPEFLPGSGTLGFGLVHRYPFTFETDLRAMVGCLKGQDAHVYRACRELQLQPTLKAIYDDDRGDGYFNGIMLEEIVKDIRFDYISGSYGNTLESMGGVSVNESEDVDLDDVEELITWVSPFHRRNELEGSSIAYEKNVISARCNPCIVARVAAACDRM